MSDSGNIKVVVRCRPMNSRERTRGASNLVDFTDQTQLVLNPPSEGDSKENARATKKKAMPFSFDRAYDENTEQQELFEYVGLDVLKQAFDGFNTCVFAYGQTGSGKSHSMVGYAQAKGLIPLTCSKLFEEAEDKMGANPNLRVTVEVSYIEIYNEKVRDLLNPKNKGNLKVREHPSLGPYVEDLSKLAVASFPEIENLMDEGNKARTVAATNMNETSSRSHAVFTLIVTQKIKDQETNLEAEKVAKVSLVDLAGSERANSTGATGSRLKEGANINRSLTTLGKVIAALAAASTAPSSKKKQLDNFVPYRDSVLTWLLKDSLGGNSKTAMIAAISPADYEETLSTLRYADSAKKIKNKAVVNEDPNAKLIRELKEELEMLRTRAQMGGMGGGEGESSWDPTVPPEKQVVRYQTKTGEIKTVTKAELQEQMESAEKLMASVNETWEDKLRNTQKIQVEREKALEELGISVEKGNVGVHTPKKLPHLVNLNEDPLMSECLVYQLRPGDTKVGNIDAAEEGAGDPNGESTSGDTPAIRLSGSNILAEHCVFNVADSGVVTIENSGGGMTMVNGKRVQPGEPRRLRSGYRVILGDFHVFRFNHPEEVRRARDRVKSTMAMSTGDELNQTTDPGTPGRPESPVSNADEAGDVDWTYARREAALARLNGDNAAFDHLEPQELDKLFEDISRARHKRGTSLAAPSRPESRLSSLDDANSESPSMARPFSLSTYTDDTSIDPWGSGGPGSRDAASVAGTTDNGDATVEFQAHADLKQKVKEYEAQLTLLQAGGEPPNPLDIPVIYTEPEKAMLYRVLAKWRAHTRVSMAEDILSNAVLLKEANVISMELDKKTTMQYTIIDDEPLSNPVSSVESIAGLDDLDDVADPELHKATKPCVAVRVIDHLHSTSYIWSLPKLEARLAKMRNLYSFIDRPEYSQHFNWADPFYEVPAPSYMFIGNALLPLCPLARKVSAKYRLPILSRHTGSEIGQCSAELRFVSISVSPVKSKTSNGTASPETTTPSDGNDSELPSGHKFGLQLSIDGVIGLPSSDFERLHVQVRLSSIAGRTVSKDEVFASAPAELGQKGVSALSDVKLRRTLTFVITPEIAEYMRSGFAPIEFHARVKSQHLTALEDYDAAKEAKRLTGRAPPTLNGSDLGVDSNSPERPVLLHKSSAAGRLSENQMISEQRHDVLAFVQLCELDDRGEYVPVQVRAQSSLDPGAFSLRQGLQRKLVLTMTHDSGRQFNWAGVRGAELSEVRLLDARGRVHSSTLGEPVHLKVPPKQQQVDFRPNGTSELTMWAWWDSSVHDSIFLNRPTPSGQRVLLRFSFTLDVEMCTAPAQFSMDIAVSIGGRDSKPQGKLMSLIGAATTGARVLTKTSALFAVRLVPPLEKRTKELWRLDTAAKYVRGEEALQGKWKPRGVSLVHDHARMVRLERRRAEVEGVRRLLESAPPLSMSNGSNNAGGDHEGLLQRAVTYWQAARRDAQLSVLAQESEEAAEEAADEAEAKAAASISVKTPAPHSSPATPSKLIAEVSLVPRTDSAAKRGWLALPAEPHSDRWIRRWFVLRRPYLYVYENSAELDELMAMHLGSVRVEHDENIERMLMRENVFGLYTAANSYFLQAPSDQDLSAWMRALDSFHTARR
ncbi:putative kinesin-3 motor protein [Ceraceosorus guamensis]|uniref:Kinesin-like protein unc-104 n=1 Tax=Ceraceosorus guamensis TaxID=1522189 RepID=A0A316WEL6_9BASI|nr:putative kinesin-3 motor protein [Ceraceosorus guamensis]PWN46193.1 putative kinesin-3 motor protein [Ceraceosorus guamensis]